MLSTQPEVMQFQRAKAELEKASFSDLTNFTPDQVANL